jgi:hypothetical protein
MAPKPLPSEMMWFDDGHKLRLQINRSELEITEIICPGTEDRECRHDRHRCLVEYFVSRYGFECNAGICPATDLLQICWTFLGDESGDVDAAQVWFMPNSDEMFSAWLVAKKNQ